MFLSLKIEIREPPGTTFLGLYWTRPLAQKSWPGQGWDLNQNESLTHSNGEVVFYHAPSMFRPMIKNKFLPYKWDKLTLGFKPPPPSRMRHLKIGLFGLNIVPCEMWIKIWVASEEKMTISVFLVNKNQYTILSDYYSQTCLLML